MPPTTRSRKRRLRADAWKTRSWRSIGPDGVAYQELGTVTGVENVEGTQVTVSEGNPWPSMRGSGEDIGSNFLTTRREFNQDRRIGENIPNSPMIKLVGSTHIGSGRYTNDSFFGAVHPVRPTPTTGWDPWPQSIASSDLQLDALGATAIARCKPTNSVADLSVAAAELYREGIPSLIGAQTWKNRARDYRDVGHEYLNVQFGWLPLVSEIKKTAKALSDYDDILTQYERDAGRQVRRSYDFPLVKEVSAPVVTVGVIPWLSGGANPWGTYFTTGVRNQGTLTKVTTKTYRRWFSGAFTYHLPSGYYSRNKIREAAAKARIVFGVELTPEVIYNATPWSWALDWVTNTGDVISNITDSIQDGLVLRYGYMMETSIVTDTYTLTGHNLKGVPGPISSSFTTVTKKRRKATPFGFGLNQSSFTDRQWSIIAALGIVRGPR